MVRVYKDSDFEEIRSWYENRGISFNEPKALSETGYIIPGVAAGFVYLTNSHIAFIDGIISNKNCDPEVRDKGIDEVINYLVHAAKIMGFKWIKAETKHDMMIERIKLLGFKVLGETWSVAKEI